MLHKKAISSSLILFLLLTIVPPATAQDSLLDFSILPVTGDVSVSLIYGQMPIGSIDLYVNGQYVNTYALPRLTPGQSVILDTIVLPSPYCSYEIRGAYSQSWFDPSCPAPQTIQATSVKVLQTAQRVMKHLRELR